MCAAWLGAQFTRASDVRYARLQYQIRTVECWRLNMQCEGDRQFSTEQSIATSVKGFISVNWYSKYCVTGHSLISQKNIILLHKCKPWSFRCVIKSYPMLPQNALSFGVFREIECNLFWISIYNFTKLSTLISTINLKSV